MAPARCRAGPPRRPGWPSRGRARSRPAPPRPRGGRWRRPPAPARAPATSPAPTAAGARSSARRRPARRRGRPCPPRPAATPAAAGAGRGRAPTAGGRRAPPPGTRSARGRRPAPTGPARAAAALAGAAGARRAPARSGTAPSGRAWPGSGTTVGAASITPGRQERPAPRNAGYLPLSARPRRISLHRLPAGDARALLAFAEKARAAAAEATGEVVAVASCYEAGYDGFWLHRVLVAAGIANLVVDPVSLKVDRRARRAKTDRIDAQALLRALMAHHRHEPRVWSPVRVPTPADEDARRTHRERQNLLKERGRHVDRIKGLCAPQGIRG